MNHDILDNSENCTNEALQTNGSSGHDPLCPYVQTAHQRDHVACQCDLIAKVHRRGFMDGWGEGHEQGCIDMLAVCIAAVEAAPISGGMRDPFTGEQRVEMFVDVAVAAMRALLEKS